MRVVRGLVGLAGAVIAVVGIYKLVQEGGSTIIEAAKWLIIGNVFHDAVVAPVAIVLGALAVRVLPVWARLPFLMGFATLATTTIAAVPVLSGMGEDPTNPSLLPRDYVGGWLVLALLTALGVAAGCWWQRRRLAGGGDDAGGVGGARPGHADGTSALRPNGIQAARAKSEGQSGP